MGLSPAVKVCRRWERRARNHFAKPFLLCLAFYTLFVAGYVGVRFSWRWLPGDAATLTTLAQNAYNEATLVPSSGGYALGYAYPILNTFLAHVGGVSIVTLQSFIQPFLIILLVPMSYAAFSRLTGTPYAAALASLLLLLQPDFLFESLRGSHAKFTWLLAMGMLFVLAQSFAQANRGLTLVRWVSVFYLLVYGLIASNAFFASSYIFGLAFAFLGGQFLVRWQRVPNAPARRLRRLLYVALACGVLFFLFLFYIYPPALRLASTFNSVVDSLSGFLLDVETSTNPYQYVQATWLSPSIFVVLTLLSWLLLGLSFVNWVVKARVLLWRRQALPSNELLSWLLYAAFAFLLAFSAVLDVAGALSANLQVRLFPHLMVVSIPLAAEAVTWLVAKVRLGTQQARQMAVALLLVSVSFFSVASMFKATNEPLLNNLWLFYTPAEQVAVEWGGPHLRGPWVWLGLDARLRYMALVHGGWKERGLEEYTGRQASDRFDLLLSETMKVQATRLSAPLPDVRGRLRVYHNGDAALYHARPRTLYQR